METKVDRRGAIQKLRTLAYTVKSEVEPFRNKIEETFDTVFLPNRVERHEKIYGGVKCDLLVPEVFSTGKIMLYIHGGSFVGGSRDSYRLFCSSLANSSSCRVVVPEFRLAPTYPFPSSLEDLQAVFRMMYADESVSIKIENRKKGLPEGVNENPEIIIAADGSGASLACALLLKLRDKYKECVTNMILFSPWLDFRSDGLIFQKHKSDEVVSADGIRRAMDLYTYSSNVENPQVSILKADDKDFASFPTTFIQMGKKEILMDQVLEFKSRLNQNGVGCILDVWPKMMHLFQMADDCLPESSLALEKVGEYIKNINMHDEVVAKEVRH